MSIDYGNNNPGLADMGIFTDIFDHRFNADQHDDDISDYRESRAGYDDDLYADTYEQEKPIEVPSKRDLKRVHHIPDVWGIISTQVDMYKYSENLYPGEGEIDTLFNMTSESFIEWLCHENKHIRSIIYDIDKDTDEHLDVKIIHSNMFWEHVLGGYSNPANFKDLYTIQITLDKQERKHSNTSRRWK